MVRLAGSRSEAAAEAADRDRNQRETVRQMGPTPLGRHRHDHRSGFNRQSRGRNCVIQRLANETLDGSFALTMETRVTLGLQFCQAKRGWIDGTGISRPSQSTVSEYIWRSLRYKNYRPH